jgi:UDP-N-acetylmuramyl pentapeptide synthase
LHSFKLNTPGVHFVYSALACIAAGRLLNVDVEQIKEAIGKDSKYISEEAKYFIKAEHFETKEDACHYLKTFFKPKDVILIKGSRAMNLEVITSCLINMISCLDFSALS